MLIIFNVSSANSAGAAASASSGFVKKPKAVVNALRSKAFLLVEENRSSTSFDEEEEQISRSLIAEEDTFFLFIIIFIPLFLAFVVKVFCSREKPTDFDDTPRRDERNRDEGIVVAAEKEEEMFIMFQVRTGGKKVDKLEKI
jgi:hypothetical protein